MLEILSILTGAIIAFCIMMIGRAKIKEEDVRHIRESKLSTAALARMYGLAHRTVSDIRTGKLWKHMA